MLKIREARRNDVAGIARVQVETWRSTYPGLIPDHVLVSMSHHRHQAAWAHALDHPRPQYAALVAAVDGASGGWAGLDDAAGDGVVGFGSCGPARDPSLRLKGEICTLYVLPEYHDLGIGRALLHGMFDCLLARGMDSAVVWVLAENPSRFFYEALGGQRVAERNECMWGTVLSEAAYGWPDLQAVRISHLAQRRF